jgi:hypothetical protein
MFALAACDKQVAGGIWASAASFSLPLYDASGGNRAQLGKKASLWLTLPIIPTMPIWQNVRGIVQTS